MFIDRVQISIKGGNGGNGCVSFYRAKYVVNGGPDGGDGGKGGNLVFVATKSETSLVDFRYKKKFNAENGEDGGRKNCSGKDGESLYIRVPVGTIIKEAKSNKIMADLKYDGEEKIIIKGGYGGKGNQHYATSVRQAPRYAQSGKLAKEYDVILELKLIADVGLIGLPNVGKSTLLSMVTNANPKIANYHFTTLSPNLGVVRSKYGKDFILADIPGLIEGASDGIGLGHEFLRHVERTKMFIHVVDTSGIEGGDPIENIKIINNELEKYDDKLLERPQIIACNKMDLPDAKENFANVEEYCKKMNYKVFPISAATNSGLEELLKETALDLKNFPEGVTIFEEDFEEYIEIEDIDEPFTISNIKGGFSVEGNGVERMLGYTNLETEKGYAFFQRYLREKGIIDALEERGIEEGNIVRLYDLEFEYFK